jgi:hypothetical protein
MYSRDRREEAAHLRPGLELRDHRGFAKKGLPRQPGFERVELALRRAETERHAFEEAHRPA